MRLTFGPLKITLAKTYLHGKSLYYQRHVPSDLRDRYPVAIIKRSLKTLDAALAARKVAELERAYDAEFAGLRASPDSSPEALTAHADALLSRWGLQPAPAENDPMARELFYDFIDTKRMRHAGGDEAAYRSSPPEEYLTTAERKAGERLNNAPEATIRDALDLYLKEHDKGDDKRFSTRNRVDVEGLIAVTGNKALKDFTRADAKTYIERSLETVKTTTVRRRLRSFSAIWATWIKERDNSVLNAFAGLKIKNEGKDSKVRVPFPIEGLTLLYKASMAADDDIRWLSAMLMDTGARISEIAGLLLEEIKVNGPTPHIVLTPQPWRDIKNKDRREVPLVGAALWAATRVVETAAAGQRFAFPRYCDEGGCRGTHASNTLNDWNRSHGFDHVNHEMRHAMKDRLRDVECPKEISNSILGHGDRDTGDGYGKGYSLALKQKWLLKVALR